MTPYGHWPNPAPLKLTMSLWQPRRKLSRLLLKPPLPVPPLVLVFSLVSAALCSPEVKIGGCVSRTVDGWSGCSRIHLDAPADRVKRETFEEEWSVLNWTSTAEEYKVVGSERAHPEHVNQGLCHKPSRAQAQPDGGYSTLGSTNRRLKPPQLPSFFFFFKFNCIVDLNLSSYIQYPRIFSPYWASKRLCCKE